MSGRGAITVASWTTVRVFPGAHRDAVVAALFDAGAQGVQEEAESLVTYAPSPTEANAMASSVIAASPDARIEIEPLAPVDWSEQWKRGIHAQVIGSLTVAPPWLAEGCDPDHTVVIDPGMAFGTGEHATTRGVIRLMHDVIRADDRVADLGAGSAVLAIAAVKLGAAHVLAIELDHDAIENAEENVARNHVADRVIVIEGDAAVLLPLVAPVHVVTANIISSVLIELLPVVDLALAADGRAILSGMLVAERDMMGRAFADAGWHVDAEDHEDAWWSATIARR